MIPNQRSSKNSVYDIAIMGGCGRAGLPLGITLAAAGHRTMLHDLDAEKVTQVARGQLPFMEADAARPLADAVSTGMLSASTDPSVLGDAPILIVLIGTPIDEHFNPQVNAITDAIDDIAEHLRDGQLLVLRSTVYPGVTRMVERRLTEAGLAIDVAFCPERIAEGHAMAELREHPQIVASPTPDGAKRAAKLFSDVAPRIITATPEEGELAKLFTNTWRYLKFAAANQLYMIANEHGVDFDNIRTAMTTDYPRAADFPSAGFAAGPCLLKDTMQLAAFNDNNFTLGQAALTINESLPLYIVSRLERSHDLRAMTVGILGMAFKGESDDTRSSLSYKLRRILRFKAGRVLATDAYVEGDDLVDLDVVLREADLLIIGAPHLIYRNIEVRSPIVDVWNLRGEGTTV